MKANGDQGKIGAAMIKGETPFDLAKAHENLRDLAEGRRRRRPACSRKFDRSAGGGRSFSASPDIWQNLEDFKARLAKLGADAKAADAW